MQPVFFRRNQALYYTLEYYEIHKIKDRMFIFSGKDANRWSSDDWLKFVFKTQEDLENEILQVIHTNKHDTQVLFFEELKEWILDPRIETTDKNRIFLEIEKYNGKTYKLFKEKIEKEVQEFQEQPNFTLPHLQEYEGEEYFFPKTSYGLLAGFTNLLSREKKIVTKINYKFYCIETSPELIDWQYFSKYIAELDGLISNLRRIIKKYVDLYDGGKIISAQDIFIQKNLTSTTNKELPSSTKKPINKLKVNLTISQLLYLFKKMDERGLIKHNIKKEIQEFIATHFEPQSKKKEGEDLSVGRLQKMWSNFDIDAINFWMDEFIKLFNEAKKDNPNKVK